MWAIHGKQKIGISDEPNIHPFKMLMNMIKKHFSRLKSRG